MFKLFSIVLEHEIHVQILLCSVLVTVAASHSLPILRSHITVPSPVINSRSTYPF